MIILQLNVAPKHSVYMGYLIVEVQRYGILDCATLIRTMMEKQMVLNSEIQTVYGPRELFLKLQADCRIQVFASLGTRRDVWRTISGNSVTGKSSLVQPWMQQMHWNNPELRSHYTDSSGLTLFYTPNLRPNDAGSFVVGQRYLDIKPGLESHTETAMASSSCTRKMLPYPIHILNNVLHMHYLGKSGYIDLRRNGNKLKTLGRDDVFSYDSPVQHVHDPPIEFLPGDEVFVSCTFDSRSKSETTYYGYDTSAEMCYGFFQYYPVIGNLTSMLNYKDVELCFNWGPRGGGEGLIVGGCSLTNAVIQSFSMKVMAKCSMTGDVCQPECKEMVKETRLNDECMGNEDVFGLVKVLSEGEPRLENIWRAFESCDDEIKMDDVLTRLILSLV
ncbi:unnamed protein product [Owenia fusiformis]|uniref:Copper type II ascorbate-dependent monooxygenase C-terminal domain-containing protein n=1 Tax=Owenia fusiformis TaxID=6347 RepID=A0A8S4Q096_OWEFU|nr:unnamed protein product [Owenia fusiformis]